MNLLCCNCYFQRWDIVVIGIMIFMSILVISSCVEGVFTKKYESIKFLKEKEIDHEKDMRKIMLDNEAKMFEQECQRKNEDLDRRIKEFEELTVKSKLLDKVIEKEFIEEVNDLKSTVARLKEDLEKAKVDISGYLFKKND